MSLKNRASKLQNQTGTARKIFDILNSEVPMSSAAIFGELNANGERVALDRIEGALKSLRQDGLVHGDYDRGWTREMVVSKIKLAAAIERIDEAAPQVQADSQPTAEANILNTASTLAERLRGLSASIHALADDVEALALSATEKSEEAADAIEQLAKIKALLGAGS